MDSIRAQRLGIGSMVDRKAHPLNLGLIYNLKIFLDKVHKVCYKYIN